MMVVTEQLRSRSFLIWAAEANRFSPTKSSIPWVTCGGTFLAPGRGSFCFGRGVGFGSLGSAVYRLMASKTQCGLTPHSRAIEALGLSGLSFHFWIMRQCSSGVFRGTMSVRRVARDVALRTGEMEALESLKRWRDELSGHREPSPSGEAASGEAPSSEPPPCDPNHAYIYHT